MTLDRYDVEWAVRRLPKNLKEIVTSDDWNNQIFIGGGYLRCVVSGDPVNDIDVFVKSAKDAELLALKLTDNKNQIVKTDNALTVKGPLPIQIIHRWVFDKAEDVSNSFDFTTCCAVIYYDNQWQSYCDERFYKDVASKRLIYRNPIRNEDAGGSMLRVLKYYQKGYRIPLGSLGAVIARMVKEIDTNKVNIKDEVEVAKIITALLVEVDPAIDPGHFAHLPG